MFRYEHRTERLLSISDFLRRVVAHVGLAAAVILVSLFGGVLGYRLLEDMSWIDALVNASMILGGMGPVNPLHSVGGKVFASLYALYSGIVFLVVVGIGLGPFLHRLLHRLHVVQNED